MMPLAPEQIETALAIQSEMIAALYRGMIAQGMMDEQEYRDLMATAQGDREVNGSLFLGPLAPLYRVVQRR